MDQNDDVRISVLEIKEVRKCQVRTDGKIEVEADIFLQYENKENHDVTLREIPIRFRYPKLLHDTTAKFVGIKTIPAKKTVTPPQGALYGDWLTMEFNALPDGSEPTCGRMLELLKKEGMEVQPPESDAQVIHE